MSIDLPSGKEIELYECPQKIEVTDWNDMSTMFFTREEVVAMLAMFDNAEDS
ncbi:hypothetical protein VPHK459_0044 [Vibrio phage K459]